jgi:hypothetical protein
MTQETLGYVKLEWTCPKCGTRNPGPEKTCQSCGAPQPDNVKFEQVEGQQLSQDEALKKIADAGPDIHCPYCGARNPGNAEICVQCGGDLKTGVRREAGQVIGAYQARAVPQIPCPRCATLNPETNLKCANCGAPLTRPLVAAALPEKQAAPFKPSWMMIAAGALVLLCLCGLGGWFLSRAFTSENTTGVVQDVAWQTVVQVEELGPVKHQDWQDEIPSNATLGQCVDKVRQTVNSQPSSGDYNKVCGTPYTKDTGTGVGQVVQDCQYEVSAPYCEYVVQEWQNVSEETKQGDDYAPLFASPQLASNQRLGDQQTRLIVVFETSQGQYEYTPNSLEEFKLYQVGTQWVLKINGFNQVVGVEPAQ